MGLAHSVPGPAMRTKIGDLRTGHSYRTIGVGLVFAMPLGVVAQILMAERNF